MSRHTVHGPEAQNLACQAPGLRKERNWVNTSVAVEFFFFFNVWPTVLLNVIMIIMYVFLWHFIRLLLLLRNQTGASQQPD